MKQSHLLGITLPAVAACVPQPPPTTTGGHGRGAVTTPYRHPSANKLTATGWEGPTVKPRGLRRWSLSSASTASLIRSLILR